MNVNRSTIDTAVFVINKQHVETLYSDLSKHLPTVEISAACTDGLTRRFESLNEFLSFKNAARCAIVELSIRAHDEKWDRFALSLRNDRGRNIRLSIDASEQVAVALNDSYADLLDSLKPWYAFVAIRDWYWVLSGLFMLWWLPLMVYFGFQHGFSRIFEPPTNYSGAGFWKAFAWGSIPTVVGLSLNLVRDRFFPMGVFALGDGEARHSRTEVIRTVCVAGFVVSILASVVMLAVS